MLQMAPALRALNILASRQDTSNSAANSDLAGQWMNPSDILSVLLLLGPDIVQKAVAAQAGRLITPVAFSFGWVAYGASSLLDAFGAGTFMPPSDVDSVLVVGADTGHSRTSSSWVLGRLLRDLNYQVDEEMRSEKRHLLPSGTDIQKVTEKQAAETNLTESPAGPKPWYERVFRSGNPRETKEQMWEALRVSVFTVANDTKPEHGVPALDLVWYSGVSVIIFQLIVAMIPWVVYGDWQIFLVTIAGNFLALAGGSLPQFREEKWACPRRGGATVAITQGNGSRHVVLIENDRRCGNGLDLEILARATRAAWASESTKTITAVLAFLWIVLLITVAGMENHTWFLLAIGAIGSAQNLYAAGARRKPAAHGMHINLKETISGSTVHPVLKRVEEKYPMTGLALLDVFYPNSLRVKTQEDKDFWKAALTKKLESDKHGTRVDCL